MAASEIGVFLPDHERARRASPATSSPPPATPRTSASSRSWVVDQLVAGTGVPFLDSTVALAPRPAATTRIRLAYGVMILPLRPVVWVAKQVASLQHVSGDRVILGVGVGGDRHERSWAAAGVPRPRAGPAHRRRAAPCCPT